MRGQRVDKICWKTMRDKRKKGYRLVKDGQKYKKPGRALESVREDFRVGKHGAECSVYVSPCSSLRSYFLSPPQFLLLVYLSSTRLCTRFVYTRTLVRMFMWLSVRICICVCVFIRSYEELGQWSRPYECAICLRHNAP